MNSLDIQCFLPGFHRQFGWIDTTLNRRDSALIFEGRHVCVGPGFPITVECAAHLKPGAHSERLSFADYVSLLICEGKKRS